MFFSIKFSSFFSATRTSLLFVNPSLRIAERLQQIICELVVENRWKIIAMEIMPDHVHLFLNVKPTDDPSSIMRKIKGRASHHLRKEFPELLKIPTLWTPSYFVSTAGNICTETVKKYIEQQRD